MSYQVSVLAEVRDLDIPALPDDEVRIAAGRIVTSLYREPRIGEPMRPRYNLRNLEGCRKVRFDKDGWEGKARFRLVFRNEPDDRSVARVTVLAIASREQLQAYREAASRLGAQTRSAQRAGRPRYDAQAASVSAAHLQITIVARNRSTGSAR
jgi:hypothetical protein